MKKAFDKFIASGSQLLGIDLYYFLRGGFWTSIPVFLESLLNVIIAVVFTRSVSQSVYGEYRFYISVLFTLALFALPGMGNAIIQSVSRKHYRSFIDGTQIILKFSLLGSISFIICTAYFHFTGRQGIVPYFLITAALFPFFYSFKTYSFFLLGQEKYKKNSQYRTSQLMFMNLFFLAAIILSKNFTIIVLVYLLAGSVSNYLMYWTTRKKYSQEIKKSRKDPGLKKYGLHLSLMQVMPLVAGNLDKILLAYFLGLEVVAVYAIAQTLAQQNKLALKPLLSMLLPRLSRQKPLQTYLFLKKKLKYIIGSWILVCTAGIALTPLLVNILFPPEYSDAVVYAQVLFLGYIFQLAIAVYSNYLTAHKSTNSLYKTAVYPDILGVAVLALLLPVIGVWGAIIAVIARNYYFFGLLVYLSRKEAYKKDL